MVVGISSGSHHCSFSDAGQIEREEGFLPLWLDIIHVKLPKEPLFALYGIARASVTSGIRIYWQLIAPTTL